MIDHRPLRPNDLALPTHLVRARATCAWPITNTAGLSADPRHVHVSTGDETIRIDVPAEFGMRACPLVGDYVEMTGPDYPMHRLQAEFEADAAEIHHESGPGCGEMRASGTARVFRGNGETTDIPLMGVRPLP